MQVVVLRIVGPGPITDAYVAAQTLPILILAIFGSPMQQLWQTRLAVAASDTNRLRIEQSAASGQMLIISVVATVPLAVSAYWWMPEIFSGLNSSLMPLAVDISHIIFSSTFINLQTLLLVSGMRAKRKFILPEAISSAYGLAALASAFWIVPEYNVTGAAWLLTARSAITYLTMWLIDGRSIPNITGSNTSTDHWNAVRPLLAGSSLYKLSPLLDRYWASMAPSGSLTILTLSQTGIGALAQVIERAVCMPTISKISQLASSRQYIAVWQLIKKTLWKATFITLSFSLVLIFLKPWWSMIAESTLRLSGASADSMWWLFLLLIGYLHVSAVGAVPVSAFIALGDSKTPVKISSLAFVIGSVVKSLAFLAGGLPALALGTSIYYVGNLFTVCYFLRKHLHVAST
jgi:putative peptidoglycan lipid II flippase